MALWCHAPRVVFPNSWVWVQTKSYPPVHPIGFAQFVSGYALRTPSKKAPAPPLYVPSPRRLSGEFGSVLRVTSHGSGWVAGSSRCATRVWTRMVVMSLVQTFRKSHQVLQASCLKSQSNGTPELMPLEA